ncbi:2-oxo acid dehydrogenase subunit E2 [Ornithinimicrobium sp. W1665]|uniref:2-oxo acid dehydrogenase subunit E2 n=1 Tax=Ornithinimicrobium sp. W1665 TaxID=3416666 RepID=UPI003CF512F3
MFLRGHRPVRGRRDARPVADLPALRRVVPHLMPTRLESTVYYRQHLEVERLTAWLEEVNQGRAEEDRIRFFHVFLTAWARLFRLRPELNRFVSARRTWEHRDITFAFTVKQAMTDEAEEAQALVPFTGTETVEQVRARVDQVLDRARRGGHTGNDRLVETLVRLPRPVVAGVARAIWALDAVDLLPRALEDAIPVYASSYLVNLGSLHAEAPFHHLYQRGTASTFVSIGTIRPEPVVDDAGAVVARRRVDVVYTIDERATDGFYLVRSSQVLQQLIDDPASLMLPPVDGPPGAPGPVTGTP